MKHPLFPALALTLASLALQTNGRAAVTSLSSANILTSYAFASGPPSTPGTYSFNIWNDSTGAFLTADNGDLPDITVTYTRTASSLSLSGTPPNWTEFISVNSAPTVINSGIRYENRIEIKFASHLNITNLQADFSSLNTAATVWEFTQLGYLKPDYTPFSAEPTVLPFLSAPNDAGMSPSTGWFRVASTGTVSGVGTSLTSAGSQGPFQALTGTNGNNFLDYTDVGLTAGTSVGGFVWSTKVEDVRGTSNGASFGPGATMFDFTPSGTITGVPETTALAPAFALLGLGCTRRRSGTLARH